MAAVVASCSLGQHWLEISLLSDLEDALLTPIFNTVGMNKESFLTITLEKKCTLQDSLKIQCHWRSEHNGTV